jgi:quercetin dioxygenase-like cupin family protein
MPKRATARRKPIVLAPEGGRAYEMGRIRAVFKADCEETSNQYSVAEWWLEANTIGPHPHAHPEDNAFYVLEGTMRFLVGKTWREAPKGSFVLVPGGTRHTFENRSGARAGILALVMPGVFEPDMEGIVAWYAKNPAGDAR